MCLVHFALVAPERNNIANQDRIEAFFQYPGWEQEDSGIDEISSYELLGKPDGIDNVLAWWKSRETTYPRLAQVARKVFSLPATSCESERNLSRSGSVLTSCRSTTAPSNVGDLIFYAVNSQVSFILNAVVYNSKWFR